jgi:hypothetical protein
MLVTVTEILTWQTPGSELLDESMLSKARQNIKVPVAKLCMLDLLSLGNS